MAADSSLQQTNQHFVRMKKPSNFLRKFASTSATLQNAESLQSTIASCPKLCLWFLVVNHCLCRKRIPYNEWVETQEGYLVISPQSISVPCLLYVVQFVINKHLMLHISALADPNLLAQIACMLPLTGLGKADQ